MRLGIPFDRRNIVAALDKIRDTASLLEQAHHFLPDYSSTLLEINNRITRILNYVGDELTVEECQLKDRDVLCAIRNQAGPLGDTAIEVVLRRQQEDFSK